MSCSAAERGVAGLRQALQVSLLKSMQKSNAAELDELKAHNAALEAELRIKAREKHELEHRCGDRSGWRHAPRRAAAQQQLLRDAWQLAGCQRASRHVFMQHATWNVARSRGVFAPLPELCVLFVRSVEQIGDDLVASSAPLFRLLVPVFPRLFVPLIPIIKQLRTRDIWYSGVLGCARARYGHGAAQRRRRRSVRLRRRSTGYKSSRRSAQPCMRRPFPRGCDARQFTVDDAGRNVGVPCRATRYRAVPCASVRACLFVVARARVCSGCKRCYQAVRVARP
jgi:hypothetical protein